MTRDGFRTISVSNLVYYRLRDKADKGKRSMSQQLEFMLADYDLMKLNERKEVDDFIKKGGLSK